MNLRLLERVFIVIRFMIWASWAVMLIRLIWNHYMDDYDKMILDRIMDRTERDGDCFIWLGHTEKGKRKNKPYGVLQYKKKVTRVNRIICYLFHGADLYAKGWVANHIDECTNSLCWNPDHLYPGTIQDTINGNVRRGIKWQRNIEYINGGLYFDKENWLRARGLLK
jgi:hypothetical protein